MNLNKKQLMQIDTQIKRIIETDSYYGKLYRELGITGVSSQKDFEAIPFSSASDN